MRTLLIAYVVLFGGLAGCTGCTQEVVTQCKSDKDCQLSGSDCGICIQGSCIFLPCGVDLAADLTSPRDAAPAQGDLASDMAVDPCGPRVGENRAYSCAGLVGACPTAGLSCVCWERGTMVCQADRTWELILDTTLCPEKVADSYDGRGCLGGAPVCGACTCDRGDHRYHCVVDGGAPDL